MLVLFLFDRSGCTIGMYDFPCTIHTAEKVGATALVMNHPAIAFELRLDFCIDQGPRETIFDVSLDMTEIQ